MSSGEEEYEVESIVGARVEKKGSKKIWKYRVHWKGYTVDHDTWEPVESFEDSEHFVENFWKRIRDGRDHARLEEYTVGEELFPVGPPPSAKSKGKAKSESKRNKEPASRTPKATSEAKTRGSVKRKVIDIEDDEPQDSSDEVRSIITEPTTNKRTSASAKKRRVEAAQSPASKWKRGRLFQIQAEEEQEVEEVISPTRMPTRKRSTQDISAGPHPPALPRRKLNSPSKETKAGNTSATRARAPLSRRASSSRKKLPKAAKEVSPDELLLVSDSEPEREQRAARERNKLEREDELMQEDTLEVPSSEAQDLELERRAELAAEAAREASPEIPLEERHAPPPSTRAKVPAHRQRGANPRVKMMETNLPVESSGISAKSRIVAQLNGEATAAGSSTTASKPSTSKSSRRVAASSKAGPGRSSYGMQGIASGFRSAVDSITREAVDTSKRLFGLGGRAAPEGDQDTAIDLSNEVAETEQGSEVPTAEELLQIAGLDVAAANTLPDYEDIDAEGEPDPDADGERVSEIYSEELIEMRTDVEITTELPEGHLIENIVVTEETKFETTTVEETTLTITTSGTIVNPPDAVIGNGHASGSNNNNGAAWKQTTIFGPLGLGREAPVSPVLPTPVDPAIECPPPVFAIVLTSSIHLPVILKDVHPPSRPQSMPLDAIVTNINPGPPAKFYKSPHTETLVNAFRAEGSCARVVLEDGAGPQEKKNFERFRSRLQAGELLVAMIGGHVLAFVSADNMLLSPKLGISPNLIGLEDSILVSEVVIEDDQSYCEAAFNAGDERW